MNQIFILSPAKTSGKRALMVLNEKAEFELARRLRAVPGVSLGELFSFMSGLYFRGKHVYAEAFSQPPEGVSGSYAITSNSGLLSTNTLVDVQKLRNFADTEIHAEEKRYTDPLISSAKDVAARLPSECKVILLGSIASSKYVNILSEAFGEKLFFPLDFIGRGDMSRGGLLLRAVSSNRELDYSVIDLEQSRSGKRPPKLAPLRS